jgi:hypothetical protein
MEFLCFRSGAHYPDAPVLSPIGAEIDRLAERHHTGSLLLDPYSSAIDSTCRAPLRNRSAQRGFASARECGGTEPPAPTSVTELYRAMCMGTVGGVVVWGDANTPWTCAEAIHDWGRHGFRPAETRTITPVPGQSWSVTLCLRRP